MLTPDKASALLAEYGEGAAWTQHCVAVADAAVRVGARLGPQQAAEVDLEALWSAALLHDIGRYVTHHPILHGLEGYALLMDLGHEEEAYVCASHILFGLHADEAEHFGMPACDFLPRTTAERLVPLVDYLIEVDTPTTLNRRFASLRERNAENAFFLARLDRAQAAARTFMDELEANMGQSVESIVASPSASAVVRSVATNPEDAWTPKQA